MAQRLERSQPSRGRAPRWKIPVTSNPRGPRTLRRAPSGPSRTGVGQRSGGSGVQRMHDGAA